MAADPRTREAVERLEHVIKTVKAGAEQRWGMDNDDKDDDDGDEDKGLQPETG